MPEVGVLAPIPGAVEDPIRNHVLMGLLHTAVSWRLSSLFVPKSSCFLSVVTVVLVYCLHNYVSHFHNVYVHTYI